MDKLLFMKCHRCRGAMVYDKFYSLQEQFWGWKCQICGEIVDPVILESRQLIGIVLIVLGVVVLAY